MIMPRVLHKCSFPPSTDQKRHHKPTATHLPIGESLASFSKSQNTSLAIRAQRPPRTSTPYFFDLTRTRPGKILRQRRFVPVPVSYLTNKIPLYFVRHFTPYNDRDPPVQPPWCRSPEGGPAPNTRCNASGWLRHASREQDPAGPLLFALPGADGCFVRLDCAPDLYLQLVDAYL